MDEAPGTAKAIAIYWFAFGTSLIATSLTYGLSTIPAIGATYLINESAVGYAMFGVLGFIVLYTADSLNLIRYTEDVDSLIEAFLDYLFSLGRTGQLTLLSLMLIYLNGIIGVGVIGGYVFDIYLGLPVIGLIFVLLYPGWDMHNAAFKQRLTLGKLLLMIILGILHFFGILRDISASGIIQRASPAQ